MLKIITQGIIIPIIIICLYINKYHLPYKGIIVHNIHYSTHNII